MNWIPIHHLITWGLRALHSISYTSFCSSPSRQQPTQSVLFLLSELGYPHDFGYSNGHASLPGIQRSCPEISEGSISHWIHVNIRLMNCRVEVEIPVGPARILIHPHTIPHPEAAVLAHLSLWLCLSGVFTCHPLLGSLLFKDHPLGPPERIAVCVPRSARG